LILPWFSRSWKTQRLERASLDAIVNRWRLMSEIPAETELSAAVSKDLKIVTIRNPKGQDDKGFATGANDGVETISMEQFSEDFFFLTVSNLSRA